MRNRKGKGGQRVEENSAKSDSKNVSESPSAAAGLPLLLWTFLLLLVAGCGIGGWYVQQQLQSIGSLDQTIQILQEKLSQFEKLQDQVHELKQKLLVTEEYEQRLLNLEVSHSDSERKLDKTVVAVAQIQSSDLDNKLATLQSEMSKSLSELRKDLLTKTDLQHVEDTVELLRGTEFARTEQQVASVMSASSKLEESVNSLSASLSSLTGRITNLEAEKQNLQAIQQSAEDISAVKELVAHSLPSLSNGVITLTNQLNQTTLVTNAIQSQIAQHGKELLGLKEVTSVQQAEHLSSKEELENIRELAHRLQTEKISLEELETAVRSTLADDVSQLQNRNSKIDEVMVNLQNHIMELKALVLVCDMKLEFYFVAFEYLAR
ncbi:hypothetical protein scyTo_0001425 [Scyliorhinus torazame]|uniref:Uncharacterized protein n=1 Tax=Scyliorhinus torazame TaxID=75743 RepID=A0A401PCY4_SCYTO|nr:hypothetical protein [Scyliorhinus torazame]